MRKVKDDIPPSQLPLLLLLVVATGVFLVHGKRREGERVKGGDLGPGLVLKGGGETRRGISQNKKIWQETKRVRVCLLA